MRVLLVDDDPSLLTILGDILKAKGMDSLSASTGAAALALAAQQEFDVALVDLRLEDMSGLDVLRGIKERSAGIECILLTGHASQDSAIQAINLGAYSYFQKPYDMEQLLVAIRRAAEKRHTEKALAQSESRFRALIEKSAEMFIVIDAQGVVKFASPSVQAILGYDPAEAVGRPFLDWVHPEDLPRALEALQSRSQTPGAASESIIVRGRHANGSWRYVEALGTNLLADASVQGIVLNAHDVTERMAHQRELEAEAMIAQSLSETLELQPLLNRLLTAALHAIPAAEKGSLALIRSDDQTLQVRAAYGYQTNILDFIYPLTWGFAGRAARECRPLLIQDIHTDTALQADSQAAPMEEVRVISSAIVAPLMSRETVIGVLSLESAQANVFQEDDLRLLTNLSTSAALIIERARLFDETRQKTEKIAAVNALGRALASTLNLQEIYRKAIEHIRPLVGFDNFSVSLYDEAAHTLRADFVFSDGQELDVCGLPPLILHEQAERVGRSGAVFEAKTFIVNDMEQRGRTSANHIHLGSSTEPQSAAYTPMLVEGKVIGLLELQSYQNHAYHEGDLDLLNMIATQIGLAVQNARLFEETRQRVKELETVNRISVALRAVSDPEEMLAIVLEETLAALNTSHGSINLLDEASNTLRRAMARGWPSEFSEFPIAPGEGIYGTVFCSGTAHISREFSQDALTTPETRRRIPQGWGGVCLPIRSAQRMLGVMLVSIPSEREFNKDELRLLNTLADMTGNALFRMKLYDETVRRAEEFAALYETNTIISAERDLNAIMRAIVQSATRLLNAAAGALYLYNPAQNELEVAIATHPAVIPGTRLHLGEGAAGKVAATRKPLRLDDYSHWEGRSPAYWNIPFQAILEVPILFGGELIGVLVVHELSNSERVYTEADERLLSLFATQAAGVIRSARLREETQRRLENLQALREVERVISASFDLISILNTVVNHIVIQLRVDAAAILLFNPALQMFEYTAGYGFYTSAIESTRFRLGEGYAGSAALSRQSIHVTSLSPSDANFKRGPLITAEGFVEYHGIPLISKGEIKGILEVFHRSTLDPSADWLELLETMAGQAAIAIDNSQLFENMQRSNLELALAYDSTIEGWSRAMELRDEETEGHTQRVTETAVTLAQALGMSPENITHLRRGALLHDIGKIGVPDHILLKAGPLTEIEWKIMRKHPVYAYEMLRSITYLRNSIDIPYMHHERWDGSGYPHGLKGEQIPLAARIFAVADVYDALTSNRPYRKAWSKEKTLEYIRDHSGKLFDPQVVEKFLELFGDRSTVQAKREDL